MGVVTWKNIAPSNPAGILSAANEAAQAMGEGIAGIGTAAHVNSDKRTFKVKWMSFNHDFFMQKQGDIFNVSY